MNTFRLLGIALMTILMAVNFTACSSDSDNGGVTPPSKEETKITIDSSITTNGVAFDSKAGKQSVSFKSTGDWTLSIAETRSGTNWVTPSAVSGGKGDITITFDVQENTEYEDRSVAVTIRTSTSSITFTITQKGVNALLVTTTKYEIDQKGGTINVEVKANIDYKMEIAESSKSWISEASTKALTTHQHSLTIAANEDYEKREGEIYFISGDKKETVHVYQNGGALILLSQDEYVVSDKGETITIELKSNCDFDVDMPNVDWIEEISTRVASSHTLKYRISANTTYDSRTAQIIYSDKNSSVKDTLTIIQVQKDAIILSQKNISVGNEGETIEIILNSNVSYETSILGNASEWIEMVEESETKALIKSTLYFKVAENKSDDSRVGKIAVYNESKSLSDTITVIQGSQSQLIISQSEYTVSDKGGEVKIEVQSNIEISVKMPNVEWITEAKTKALNSYTYIYNIAPNETYNSRSTEIMFSDKNSDLRETVKITQVQKDAIILSSKSISVDNEGEIIEVLLSSNVDFEIEMPNVDWINQISTKALTEYKINFEISKNESKESRTAEIVFSNSESNISETLTITQQGNIINSVTKEGDLWIVTKSEAGNLLTLLENDALIISSLKINGPLNGDDIKVLRQLLGGYEYHPNIKGILTSLDLTNTSIVGGGNYYYIDDIYGWEHYLSKDEISYSMFYKTNLQSILLPNNVTVIDISAFKDCKSLTSVTIGEGVTTIRDSAFEGCDALINITIPNSVKTIGSRAFENCEALTDITIPNSVKIIGNMAFAYCKSLINVTISNNLTTIGIGTFMNCEALTNVIIPNSVTTIGNGAFYSCKSLTSVIIPNSMTTIEELAFSDCVSLSKFTSHAIAAPTLYSNDVFKNISSSAILYVPEVSISDYQAWGSYFGGGIQAITE